MSARDVLDYFNTNSQQYIADSKPGFDEKLRYISEHSSPGDKMLDVGCGSAAFLEEVLAKTPVQSGVGIDFATDMIPKNSPVDGLILADAQSPPFNAESFDFINVDTVLHHIVGDSRRESKEMVATTICGLMELLSDGGIMLISERIQSLRFGPNKWLSYLIFYGLKYGSRWVHSIHPNINRYTPPICFFTMKELELMIEEAGGVIESTEEFFFPVANIHRVFSPSGIRVNIYVR